MRIQAFVIWAPETAWVMSACHIRQTPCQTPSVLSLCVIPTFFSPFLLPTLLVSHSPLLHPHHLPSLIFHTHATSLTLLTVSPPAHLPVYVCLWLPLLALPFQICLPFSPSLFNVLCVLSVFIPPFLAIAPFTRLCQTRWAQALPNHTHICDLHSFSATQLCYVSTLYIMCAVLRLLFVAVKCTH